MKIAYTILAYKSEEKMSLEVYQCKWEDNVKMVPQNARVDELP
jgi:hypothetical protein